MVEFEWVRAVVRAVARTVARAFAVAVVVARAVAVTVCPKPFTGIEEHCLGEVYEGRSRL
jgi:hypothetical protein